MTGSSSTTSSRCCDGLRRLGVSFSGRFDMVPGGEREVQAERRPPARGRVEGDAATLLFYEAARHEQPQPGAVRLGREVGLKQFAAVGGSDAAAVVLHFEDQGVARLPAAHGDTAALL